MSRGLVGISIIAMAKTQYVKIISGWRYFSTVLIRLKDCMSNQIIKTGDKVMIFGESILAGAVPY